MPFLIVSAVLLAILVTVLIVRTVLFVPRMPQVGELEKIAVDTDRAAGELSALIACKTVSNQDRSLEDESEFAKLERILPKIFPIVFKKCEFEKVGDRGLLLRWSGKSQTSPTVLMAHYDVVAADGSQWSYPPFSPEIHDGFLYGRGTLDTKLTVAAMLHAAERLMERDFTPLHDIYFAFGGDEEVSGHGASEIVALFEKRGIYPALVLDEGGAVVKGAFPGVRRSAALIGIAEKGMANIAYTVRGGGGHASTPKGHTPVTRLARAATRAMRKPFPYRMTLPTKLLLDRVMRHSTFGYRLIFANLWFFSPIIRLITRDGGDLAALLRTTVAFTEMHGAEGMNVIPAEATLMSNSRILPGETPNAVRDRLAGLVDDPEVEVSVLSAQPPSRLSLVDCPEYARVESTASEVWPNAIASPYLMLACSDSRHWGRLSDRVYRFSPLEFVGDERATIHGNDERIALSSIDKAVEFFYRFIRKS